MSVVSVMVGVLTDERTRVLFILGSLAGGGAERIVSHLVGHLNPEEFDARVGLLWRHGEYLNQVADSALVVARLGQGWVAYRDQPPWWQLLPSLALVPLQQRELVQRFRPHIVLTATKSMNLAARFSLAGARRHLRWIAREGNNTGAMIDSESPNGLFRALQNLGVRISYGGADRIVAISDGVGRALASRFQLPADRVITIYNSVDIAVVQRRALESSDVPPTPLVAAAGRLVHQKGFDVLLRAFSRVAAARPLSLVILGDGPDRSALTDLARTLGIAERVQFRGFVANPWSHFARAAMFVCSSRWEGFGNVIVEAMACGTPVVSTDCDYGPREIVRHRESGLLVPVDDDKALAQSMASVLDDQQLAARLAEGSRTRANDFDVSRMTQRYERLFRELRSGL